MGNKPQLYKFSDIEHRLHTLEPGQTYIKPFVTSKVSDTMCGGLNFLNKISVPWDLTCDEIIYCMKGTFRLTCDELIQLFSSSREDMQHKKLCISHHTHMKYDYP